MYDENNIERINLECWPEKLYKIGRSPILSNKNICIVGTRKPSSYGRQLCRDIIYGLKDYPVNIVSGMALGIDSYAHDFALDCNLQTIAFPGSGLNQKVLYPRRNLKLADKILYYGGCLISERRPDTVSAPWIFPKRNELMSSFSDMIIVIECSLNSGSLITANYAKRYNKIVACTPGSVYSYFSSGPHFLLKNGAVLIEDASDIIKILKLQKSTEETLFSNNQSDKENSILSILEKPKTKQEIINMTNLTIQEIQETLSLLEIKDLIEENRGFYKSKICKKNPL